MSRVLRQALPFCSLATRGQCCVANKADPWSKHKGYPALQRTLFTEGSSVDWGLPTLIHDSVYCLIGLITASFDSSGVYLPLHPIPLPS